NEFAWTDEATTEQFADQNLKVIHTYSSPAYNVLCTKPVESVDQAAGLRIRTSGDIWSASIEEIGGVPVSLPFNEAYEGLQRGVIDCVTVMPAAFLSFGFVEVAHEFVPITFAQTAGQTIVMNLD